MEGIFSENGIIKLSVSCDPSYDLDEIQPNMRHVYHDETLHKAKNNIGNGKPLRTAARASGRESRNISGNRMEVAGREENSGNSKITCYRCKGKGHKKLQCPSGRQDEEHEDNREDNCERKKSKGKMWCSLHKTTFHRDED